MKNGIALSLTLVCIVAGFTLVFCRQETEPEPRSRTKTATRSKFADEIRPAEDRARPKPERPAKPPKSAPAELTPEQEEEERNRLERLAEAKAVFETAVANGDATALASRDFLDANSQQPGVTVTGSGLQYQMLEAGAGAYPAATDTVKVHYHGTLPDGTVFDSSIQRGAPMTFPLNAVVAGWTEGLQLMPLGSKCKLFVPSWLAYGGNGQPNIPPHTVLIFEIEFLEVVSP